MSWERVRKAIYDIAFIVAVRVAAEYATRYTIREIDRQRSSKLHDTLTTALNEAGKAKRRNGSAQ